jgi:hypothetical protein
MNELSESPASRRRARPPIWVVVLAVIALLLEKLQQTYPHRAMIAPSRGRGPHTPDIHGRGRSASTPSEIPAKGWKDILWRVYSNLSEHRILAIAAGVTFFVLLAIFPGIADGEVCCSIGRWRASSAWSAFAGPRFDRSFPGSAFCYLLGTGLPPGLPSGTRYGFTAPVVPPLAPRGLPAPGTATGA